MANENYPKYTAFLTDLYAKQVFAKLDYLLKSGVHIQYEHPEHEDIYRFLAKEEVYNSLKEYYKDFFGVVLSYSSNDKGTRYYFIDFEHNGDRYSRGKLENNYKHLESEYLVIGIMLCLMCCVENYGDKITSILEFNELLDSTFKDCKEHLELLVLKNSKRIGTGTNLEQKEWEDIIQKAFKRFKELGWIYGEVDGTFKVLPALNRLRDMYKPWIIKFDEYRQGNFQTQKENNNES